MMAMSSQQKRVQDPRQQRELLEELVDHDIDDGVPTPVADLLTRDYPLSNIDRTDREYFRLLSENIAIYVRETYPPDDSLVQGDLGAALLEDPEYGLQSMPEQTLNEIETLLMTTFARSSRGIDGWQQDKLSESIDTQRIEDQRQPEEDGVLGGLFE